MLCFYGKFIFVQGYNPTTKPLHVCKISATVKYFRENEELGEDEYKRGKRAVMEATWMIYNEIEVRWCERPTGPKLLSTEGFQLVAELMLTAGTAFSSNMT